MPRRQLIPVQDEDQFQQLLREVVDDLGKVNDRLALFNKLVEAQHGQFWRGMCQSPAYWSTTLGAMQDAALYGLSRAYDQNDDSLNLRTLLELIESAPAFLTRPVDFDQRQLQADLDFVSHETNLSVKHLMIWRHKFFAHRDPYSSLNRNLSDQFPLKWDEIGRLLDSGFTILNRYDVLFFRNSTSRDVHGHEDYLRLLQTLQDWAEGRHEELMDQLRKAEGEGT